MLHRPKQHAVTMLELLLAITIMTMLAAALGGMASGVYRTNEYSEGYGLATQHARVALERIRRAVSEASANELFPGAIVLSDTVGGYDFPDTLVVWNPTSDPLDENAGPRMNEIIVFCTNPSAPNELWEITQPTSTATVPTATDIAGWKTAVSGLKNSSTANKVVVTDLLRIAEVSEVAANTTGRRRGCLRFERRVLPSEADWTAYLAASNEAATWTALPWAQTIYGTKTGLRQTWVRIEMQLMPGVVVAHDVDAMPAAPFFGSAALYYEMDRK
jgi:type II secretory pathway pseudopilin PulG